MKPVISPRDLAAAIGVSESSLKRWADEGLIRVSKTVGGHRRIAIGEAIRFIRAIRAPLVRPEVLGLTDVVAAPETVYATDSPAELLYDHLLNGRARAGRSLILSLYLTGHSVVEIADGPLRDAMRRLGELWQHDSEGVYREHRATDICLQAVQQLRHLVEPQEPGPIALGGAISDDPYLLPTLLAATTLSAEGWTTINLGPDTPIDALLAAADRHAPRLVWVSMSAIRHGNSVEAWLRQAAERLGHSDVPLAVGGRALSQITLPQRANVHRCETMSELAGVARAVHGPTPTRPSDDAPTP